MAEGTAFVKGQKIISPFGEGSVVEVTGDQVTILLESGEQKMVPLEELQDDSDAG
jgi:hypothetical protein